MGLIEKFITCIKEIILTAGGKKQTNDLDNNPYRLNPT